MITDIYLIKTQNSIYEVHVAETGISRCRKVLEDWKQVKSIDPEYLEKLVIGASFDVPGVVLTSVVKDYQHFVPSGQPKRSVGTIPAFFENLSDAIIGQVRQQAIRVGENDKESYS